MKFLIDHQLPPALAGHLRALGADAVHVLDLGLDQKPDGDIWQSAAADGFVIVSQDSDFLHLANRDSSGPQLVWVRIGNCRTPRLLAAVDRVWLELVSGLASGARVVEVR